MNDTQNGMQNIMLSMGDNIYSDSTISCYPETYTEQRLYFLCAQNAKKIKIFYEWQHDKEHYINRIKMIAKDYPHYSMHGVEHSQAIIEAVEMFLGRWRIDRMGIGDLWLLLNAAYGHDIGMVIQHDEALELWRSDQSFKKYLKRVAGDVTSDMCEYVNYYMQLDNLLHSKKQMEDIEDEMLRIYDIANDWPIIIKKNVTMITADYIRRHHQERSKKFFDIFSETIEKKVTEDRLYRLLGQVSFAHGQNLDYIMQELPVETNGFGNEKIHPQFVAMLIRLGDLLDLDNNRFDIYTMEHFGMLPATSKTHYQKHLAVSHFLVTEYKIEAEERTENLETCKAAYLWFDYIRTEVAALTSHWNAVVPKELLGCTFQKCDLKVYLCGNEYKSSTKERFEVDNKRFMEVLIGDKLYEDRIAYLREYVQNAIDATKLYLWISAKSGDWESIFTCEEYRDVETSPMDLNGLYLENFVIKVKLELKEVNNKEFIRIEIIDRGIGMDEECLEALAVIGTGWRGRKKYVEVINSMPPWLKPTGGFGIGIQSGFMITDEIDIITKGMEETNGYEIHLKSPAKSGELSYEVIKGFCRGTKVIIDINMMDILKRHEFRKNIGKQLNNKSIFIYEDVLMAVAECMEQYLKTEIPNSLIPIKLICIADNKVIFKGSNKGKLDYKLNRQDLMIYESIDRNFQYGLSEDMQKCFFWLQKYQIYMEITSERDENGSPDVVCYKGVKLDFLKRLQTSSSLIYKNFPVFIDVMGKKAEDCLLISRSHFKDETWEEALQLSKEAFFLYTRQLATDMLKKYDSIEIKEHDKRTLIDKESLLLNLLYGALLFGKDTTVEGFYTYKFSTTFDIQVCQVNENNKKIVSKQSAFNEIYDIFADKNQVIVWNMTNEDEGTASGGLSSFSLDNFEKNMPNEVDGSKEELCVEEEIIQQFAQNTLFFIKNRQLRDMLNDVYADKKMCFNLNYNIDTDIKYVGLNYVVRKQTQEKETDVKRIEEIIRDALNYRYYYIVVGEQYEKDYSDLFINLMPVENGKDSEFLKRNNAILLPFSKELYSVMEQEISEWTFDNFMNKIMKDIYWKRTVEWVKRNNKKQGLISNVSLSEQYVKLCKILYNEAYKKCSGK